MTPPNTSNLIFGLSQPGSLSHMSTISIFYHFLPSMRVYLQFFLSPPVINSNELKADLDADGIVCWARQVGADVVESVAYPGT